MIITELQQLYATHPNVEGMCKLLKDNSVRHLYCSGLCASAASLFSSVLVQQAECPFVFILGDLEEAGYFYHDLIITFTASPGASGALHISTASGL